MNSGKSSHSEVASNLRERAKSILDDPDLEAEEISPTVEMLKELRLQRLEIELQNEELQRKQQELEKSREHYSNLYFHAPVGYLILDQEGQIGEVNYLAAELLGVNRRTLLETSLFEHVKSCCRHKLDAHLKNLFENTGVQHCTLTLNLSTDSTVHLKMLSIAIDNGDGGPLQCRSAIFDITREHQAEREKQILEEQLHEAHRMETLGRLASGIAHDFNNLLTLIIGYSKLAINQLPEDTLFGRHAREINKAGHHAAELIEQLLTFSRSGGSSSTPVAVNELILDMETMLDRLIGDDIELRMRLHDQLGVVHFDSSQFQQVLMNLVVNAREAMPEGGSITLCSRNANLTKEQSEELEVEAGPYVIIEVEDNGHGIPEEVIPHIFEPFFTTKTPDNKHGFGLSTTYGIVRRHGGVIDVHSERDEGTVFRVYLPRVDDMGVTNEPDSPTVLVVDDQPDLRDFATLVLEETDLNVISARGPDEALELSRAYGQNIDLVVTDVTMPGMNGPVLLERIRQNHPDADVLYISGYDRETLSRKHDIDADAPFLEKPFSPENLRELVANLLEGDACNES